MNLYEILNICDYDDIDVSDYVFDITLTVSRVYQDLVEQLNYYDIFCMELYKKLKVKQIYFNSKMLIVDFYNFITTNFDLLSEFSKNNWKVNFEDKDDFIYSWIKEFKSLLNGNGTESIYKLIIELLNKCEGQK